MEDRTTLIESLFEKAEVYAKTNVDLFKLKAIDKSADIVSTAAAKIAIIIVASVIIIMMNIGLALWIGELMEKSYYGFFIVAVFYLAIDLVLHFFKDQLIKTPVNDSIIIQMLKEK